MFESKRWARALIAATALISAASQAASPRMAAEDDYDDIDVIIAGRYPQTTLIAPSNGAVYQAPISASNKISLVADASSRKSSIAQVQFVYRKDCEACGETPLAVASRVGGTAISGRYQYDWTNASTGEYRIRAKVTDAVGNVSFTGTVLVAVCAAPTVTLVAPTADQRIDIATGGTASILLKATTSAIPASCGTVSRIEYYNGSTLIGSSSVATGNDPFSYSWSGIAASAAPYPIKAKAFIGAATTGVDSAVNQLTVNNLPAVSMTSPANGAFVAAPATISFSANATDTGGNIAKVEALNGATVLNTVNTTGAPSSYAYSYTWSGVPAGTYSALTVRATDNNGASVTAPPATVTVCATPTIALTSPAADPTTVQLSTSAATASITLSAAVSAPATGCIGTVEYYSGATKVAAGGTGAPWSANWANVAAGTYSIKARVYAVGSSTIYSESAPVTLYVNAPPSVTLVTPASVEPALTYPGALTLSAIAVDADSAVQSVSFYTSASTFNKTTLIGTVITGQAAANGQPAQSGSTYNYVWTPTVATYSVTARATDLRGGVDQSVTNSVAVCGAPAVTLTTSTPLPIFLPANTATLNASASQLNNDARCGTISQVEFFQTGVPAALGADTTTPYSFTVSGLTAGTTTYTAKVTDSAGRTATSTPPLAIVVNSNTPPTVSISTPYAVVATPALFTFTANASDSDGTVTRVDYYKSRTTFDQTTWIGSATTVPWSFTWTGVVSGVYDITAKATDNRGAESYSAPIVVVANNLPSVSITSPANGATFVAPATVIVQANAIDSDGSIVSVNYEVDGSGLGSTRTVAPYRYDWTSVAAGTYILRAQAADNRGQTNTSSPITITVNPASSGQNPPSVLVFGSSGMTVPLNSAVTFNYTVNDPDVGQTLTVRLVRVAGSGIVDSVTVASGAPRSGTLTWPSATPLGDTAFRLEVSDGLVTTTSANTITITVAMSAANELLTFIHPNVNGSPIMATNSAGAIVWNEDYSAFGERVKNQSGANSGAAANQNWFIGKPVDNATGLVYFGARWYDPQVGRFLGFDPAGVDEGNPHSFNRYAYGNNNPNKYLDPDGRFPLLVLVYAAPAVATLAARAAPFAQRAVAAAMNTVTTLTNSSAVVNVAESAASFLPGAPPTSVNPVVSAATPAKEAVLKVLEAAHPTSGHPTQVMTTLADGTRVLFRKDFGKKAHELPGPFEGKGKVDHYNVEVQSKSGKKKLEDLHLVPDGKGGLTIFGKDGVIKGE